MYTKYEIVPFCPYHFVRTILSNTILSVYHFVRYHFVRSPFLTLQNFSLLPVLSPGLNRRFSSLKIHLRLPANAFSASQSMPCTCCCAEEHREQDCIQCRNRGGRHRRHLDATSQR